MELTAGFILIFISIIIPGLLFRRLFYTGEFSKQFYSGDYILSLSLNGVIPGIMLLAGGILLYTSFIDDLNYDNLFSFYLNLQPNSSEAGFTTSDLKEFLTFHGFLYLSSAILGFISSKLIRFLNLDLKTKIFRFRNEWYYLFSGEILRFKKFRTQSPPEIQPKFLFASIDVMLRDDSEKNILLSGFLVDYELHPKNPHDLLKLYLKNPKRYKYIEGQLTTKNIPGDILVVMAEDLIDINISYIYSGERQQTHERKKQRLLRAFVLLYTLLSLVTLPLFLFNFSIIDWTFYQSFFETYGWFSRLFLWIASIQVLSLFFPIVSNKSVYSIRSFKQLAIQSLIATVLILIFYFLAWL